MSTFFDDLKLDDAAKALVKEMGEDPAQKMSKLEVLKKWIMTHNYIECRTDDKFLLTFLRVSKYSCEAAKERITNYCVSRSSKLDGLPEWFENRDVHDPEIKRVLEVGMIYVMPKTDDLGRLVIAIEAEKMGGEKDPVLIMRAIYLFLDWLVFRFERSQINGMVIVESASSFNKDLMGYWADTSLMKKSLVLWQGAMPMRMKRLEYYNMHVLMKTLMEPMIKLMKPKMAKRIAFHSDKKKPQDIPIDCMPPWLDGEGPTWDDVKDETIRDIEHFQSDLDMLNMCRVDEAKRPKKYEEGDSWGITGTYRNIEGTE